MKIKIEGCTITDNAHVLNGAKIDGNSNSSVEVLNTTISGSAHFLEKLDRDDIDDLLKEADKRANRMSENDPEREAIEKLVKDKNENRKYVLSKIADHLAEFTQGVLANIVSEMLMGRI